MSSFQSKPTSSLSTCSVENILEDLRLATDSFRVNLNELFYALKYADPGELRSIAECLKESLDLYQRIVRDVEQFCASTQ